jgi:hypothetical protein
MNLLTLLSVVLVALASGQLAALVGIMARYAIPRAPFVFRLLLLFPMLTSSIIAMLMAFVALSGAQGVAGISGLALLLVYVSAAALWIWVLVAYAVYWHIRGRHCRA